MFVSCFCIPKSGHVDLSLNEVGNSIGELRPKKKLDQLAHSSPRCLLIWCCNQTQGIDYQSVQRQGESANLLQTKEPPSGMGGCWYGCDHVPSPSVGGWACLMCFVLT